MNYVIEHTEWRGPFLLQGRIYCTRKQISNHKSVKWYIVLMRNDRKCKLIFKFSYSNSAQGLIFCLCLQGVELGPLEITINSLAKSIEAEQSEIGELQQMWLRDQSQLVRLSKDKDAQSRDVDNLKKQLTILSQKKLRIECKERTLLAAHWCKWIIAMT